MDVPVVKREDFTVIWNLNFNFVSLELTEFLL
jgi:hypothetical protein